jgi:hypothetical protein
MNEMVKKDIVDREIPQVLKEYDNELSKLDVVVGQLRERLDFVISDRAVAEGSDVGKPIQGYGAELAEKIHVNNNQLKMYREKLEYILDHLEL